MHKMRTIAISDPGTWAFVTESVKRATVLIHSPDGATFIQPLLHYCSHLLRFCRPDWCVQEALEVFLNDMHYINSRFTYLLTYIIF